MAESVHLATLQLLEKKLGGVSEGTSPPPSPPPPPPPHEDKSTEMYATKIVAGKEI